MVLVGARKDPFFDSPHHSADAPIFHYKRGMGASEGCTMNLAPGNSAAFAMLHALFAPVGDQPPNSEGGGPRLRRIALT